MYQISLIAAFVAGMVALFAPCCISYLLPAYLGNIFKERRQVLFMTIVYSLGIFVIMLPIVLGAKALSAIFFQLHDWTYIVGSILMILIAFISFLGIKLPMPHIAMKQKTGSDVVSTFTLGIFSGITSACCAPVLVGVITLSTLSPTIMQSLGVGAAYVLGMVSPLYFASFFIDRGNVLANPILKRKLTLVKIFGNEYPIFVSNVIAGIIFLVTGVIMFILAVAGKLGMSVAESQVTKSINQVAFGISEKTGNNPLLNILFAAIALYLIYRYAKRAMNGNKMKSSGKYSCPMHPEVVKDAPGICPKCGMKLEEVKNGEMSDESKHMHHDHASMMATPEAAKDFLRRFFIVTVLLVPLAVFSAPAVRFLGIPDFALRPYLEFGIATAIFYFGLVFFQHAKHEIKSHQYGMMTLVSVGVGGGYLFSAVSTFLPAQAGVPAIQTEFYLEISTLIWVLLFGHFLEAKSSSAAGDALAEVAKLLPKSAHLKTKGGAWDVEVSTLQKGDVVVVKAGEKVPADGVIVKGGGNFNEAHITGESKPVERKINQEVVAGAINIDGSVEVKLLRVGESSTIGQIKNLIAHAKTTKPSAQRLADRAAKWLTFSALGVAILALIIWSVVVGQTIVFAGTLAITVLVIACPHALGLAIPTVSTIATKLAVANGVFIKDMGKIEVVKSVTCVVFDKTGTLTKGDFGVTNIISFSNNEKQLLEIAGAIEAESSHVIGMAISQHLAMKKLKPKGVKKVKNLAGRGMEAEVGGPPDGEASKKYFVGNKRLMEEKKVWNDRAEKELSKLSEEAKTPVFVASREKLLGVIALSDEIKKESGEAISELHGLGVKVAMLTGDTEAAAAPIAKELGIDKVFAEVLPEDKYKYIKELQDKGNVVLMAGDGVNDAPALTQANVGVAIGAGTDVAVEAGDIVLTQSNPEHVVRLIVLSRKVYRKMIENLFWALGYNVLAIPAAAGLFIPLGFRLTPAVGALLMSASSAIVVTNAISLRNAKLTIG